MTPETQPQSPNDAEKGAPTHLAAAPSAKIPLVMRLYGVLSARFSACSPCSRSSCSRR